MALMTTITKNIPLAGSVDIPSYCKVVLLHGNKDMMQASMIATAGTADGEPVESFFVQFVPTLDGSNFIAQAYARFKTLPEFASATDC